MRTLEQTRATMRQFIYGEFPAAREQSVADSDSLLELGVVDSLGVLDIVAFIEAEFDVQVADDELDVDDFQSILTLSQFIQRKLGCTSSA